MFNRLLISSCQGAVLSRRPVAERRHLGRVLCGLTCPLRYAPSESAAAGTTQRLDSGHPGTNDQSPNIPALRIRLSKPYAPFRKLSEKMLLNYQSGNRPSRSARPSHPRSSDPADHPISHRHSPRLSDHRASDRYLLLSLASRHLHVTKKQGRKRIIFSLAALWSLFLFF